MSSLLWLWTFAVTLRRDGDASYASSSASNAVRSWRKRVESWSAPPAKLQNLEELLSAQVAKVVGK